MFGSYKVSMTFENSLSSFISNRLISHRRHKRKNYRKEREEVLLSLGFLFVPCLNSTSKVLKLNLNLNKTLNIISKTYFLFTSRPDPLYSKSLSVRVLHD